MGDLILDIFTASLCFLRLWQVIFQSFWAGLSMKSNLQLEEALCQRARQRTATVIPLLLTAVCIIQVYRRAP